MPGFDGTGPVGRGPGTGRGLGVCRGAFYRYGGFYRRPPGMMSPAYRKGAGFMRGRRSGVDMRRRPEDY